MAHRRIVSESLAATRKLRPLSILSPPATPKLNNSAQNDADIEEAVLGLEAQKSKLYCEGFLLKLDDLTSDGNRVRAEARNWQEVYARLQGNVLSLWIAKEFIEAQNGGQEQSKPQYINITDARILRPSTAEPSDIILSTAGKNRYVIRAPIAKESGIDMARRWLLAIRLSIFERARAQEAYTANLYLRYVDAQISDVPARDEKWAGYGEVRLVGGDICQSEWKKMWISIHTQQKSSLLRKAKTTNEHTQEIRFYEDKKDKSPFAIMNRVYAAYSIYPEHMSLVSTVGMIKVEGQIPYRSTLNKDSADGFALIMPCTAESSKRLSGSSTMPHVGRLLQLLCAIWNAFELYNSPRPLLLNTDHAEALGNAGTLVDISLDHLMGLLPVSLSNEQAWRKALREQHVLQSHYTQVRGRPITPTSPLTGSYSPTVKRTGNDRRIVSESAIPAQKSLVRTISEDERAEALEAARFEALKIISGTQNTHERKRSIILDEQRALPSARHSRQSSLDASPIQKQSAFASTTDPIVNIVGGHRKFSAETVPELTRSVSSASTQHESLDTRDENTPYRSTKTHAQSQYSLASERSVSIYSADIDDSLALVHEHQPSFIDRFQSSQVSLTRTASLYSTPSVHEDEDQVIKKLVQNRASVVNDAEYRRKSGVEAYAKFHAAQTRIRLNDKQ